MAANCGSCGAGVLWAVTTKGKRIPLDDKPAAGGNIWILDGVAHVATRNTPGPPGQPRYVSHFATCPHGPHWRGRAA